MLIACQECHRQYDVGQLKPGRKVRCLCGTLNVVPQRQVKELEMLHCATCGGRLERASKTCGFCAGELALTDRGVGDACPECFARLIKDARFCSSCGTAIRPQIISRLPAEQACPRCASRLSLCEIPGGAFIECTGCAGIWLDEQAFRRATEQQEHSSIARYFHGRPGEEAPAAPVFDPTVTYLKCPLCQQLMNRRNFARISGVIIDWCKGHGYWFDADELELIMQFVAVGGLEEARRKQIERQKRDVIRGEARARNASRRTHPGAHAALSQEAGMGWFGGGIVELLSGLLASLFD